MLLTFMNGMNVNIEFVPGGGSTTEFGTSRHDHRFVAAVLLQYYCYKAVVVQ